MNELQNQDQTLAGSEAPVTTPFNWSRIWAFAGFAGLVALAFFPPLRDFFRATAGQQAHSHIPLIPLISLYLIWEKRLTIRASFHSSPLPAFFFACVGAGTLAFLYFVPRPRFVIDHYAIIMASFLCFIVSGAFMILGWAFLKKIIFPVCFLIFMIPTPSFIVHWTEIQLQYASAEAAYWMLNLLNVPMVREGVDFKLPGIMVRVAEECSGFNATYVLFIVSLLAGFLFLKSKWKRTFLAIAVIPLAIIRNGFRITTISALCVYKDPSMIDSVIHHRGGPIFFALSLVPFLILLWYLRRSELKTHSKTIR